MGRKSHVWNNGSLELYIMEQPHINCNIDVVSVT